jgi:hypothetical protein
MKDFLVDAITGPGILMLAIVYYKSVNLEIAAEVLNANDAMLLASVAIIMAVMARLLSMTAQTKPWFFIGKGGSKDVTPWHIFDEKVLVLVLGIGTLYLNSRIHVFTGAQMTSDALFRLMFPYLMLAVIALIGFNVLRYSKFLKRHLIVALFLAPLCLMLFSALRGLDLFGFMIAYRSYNFIDIPMAITAGVGLAYIMGKLAGLAKENKFFKPFPAFAMALFVMFCCMSLPLAYNSQEAFDVQETTLNYEFVAMEWAAEHNVSNVVTDQRFGDIIDPYFDVQADNTGPWILKSSSLAAGDVLFASNIWTREGAQMYPFGRVDLDEKRMAELMDGWDVCYVGGPRGREMIIAIVH